MHESYFILSFEQEEHWIRQISHSLLSLINSPFGHNLFSSFKYFKSKHSLFALISLYNESNISNHLSEHEIIPHPWDYIVKFKISVLSSFKQIRRFLEISVIINSIFVVEEIIAFAKFI